MRFILYICFTVNAVIDVVVDVEYGWTSVWTESRSSGALITQEFVIRISVSDKETAEHWFGGRSEVVVEVTVDEWVERAGADGQPVEEEIVIGRVAVARHHWCDVEVDDVNELDRKPGYYESQQSDGQHLNRPPLWAVKLFALLVRHCA